MRRQLKNLLLRGINAATGRHGVLLPKEAGAPEEILAVEAPYRIEGNLASLKVLEPAGGHLRAELLTYEGHFPTRRIWSSDALPYTGPSRLSLDLGTGVVTLGDQPWGEPVAESPRRRFCWRLQLSTGSGEKSRLTGHYRAMDGAEIGADYFTGDNYVDHEAETVGERKVILQALKKHRGQSPLLEVGCATGGTMETLDQQGLQSFGLDISDWAVEQANQRVGGERAFVCDLDVDPVPEPVQQAAPYSTLLLWAVLEHFAAPFQVLERLTQLAAPGALLLINTTNAQSLTRHLFAQQWEGHFDGSHRGVATISAQSLRRELPRIGWEIESLSTHSVWTTNADPTHQALRDVHAADGRFRRLLQETETGDFIVLAARKG